MQHRRGGAQPGSSNPGVLCRHLIPKESWKGSEAGICDPDGFHVPQLCPWAQECPFSQPRAVLLLLLIFPALPQMCPLDELRHRTRLSSSSLSFLEQMPRARIYCLCLRTVHGDFGYLDKNMSKIWMFSTPLFFFQQERRESPCLLYQCHFFQRILTNSFPIVCFCFFYPLFT